MQKYTLEKEEDRAAVKRWVKALRSGEYKQTQGTLRRVPKGSDAARFCCLGVLADLEIDGKWGEPHGSKGDTLFAARDGSRVTGFLSKAHNYEVCVVPWLDTEFTEELADLNDSGASFAEIADRIEEALL